MDFLFIQFLEGLASASSLFLVAAGLSLIFGVTRIVNFAHGSLYMLGAYLAWSLTKPLGFWLAVPLAALAVGALSLVLEILLLRRLYGAPELFQLLATFALTLMADDLVPMIWGPEDLLGPHVLRGSVMVFGHAFPLYDAFLITLGPVVMGGLWWLLKRTRFGVLLRAATVDREMVALLGINQSWLFTAVFTLGGALAGLGGALELPRMAIHPQMGGEVVVTAFVVVVVGGLDSLPGAFLAAALLGELAAFGTYLWPKATLVLMFAAMALVLSVRPRGLLGSAMTNSTVPRITSILERAPLIPRRIHWIILFGGLILLAGSSLVLGNYPLSVASEMLILGLFAASLLWVSGLGGMTSFGHAAWFGLGAYVVALTHTALGMASLGLAPVVAGLAAWAFALLALRLSGVYLAMLTLAAAQIVHSVAFQTYDLTGGDNGILGVWPAAWASTPVGFFLLTLAIVGGLLAGLWWLHGSPFGYALRAVRDSALRAGAIGIDGLRQRRLGFALGGGLAGIAGGLFAFLKGSVFPDVASISTSVDALVMMLLGGMGSLLGPLVGAAAYTGLRIGLSSHTDFWRLAAGIVLIGLVLVYPGGLLGGRRR